MWDNIDKECHFLGEFCLNGENLHGEILHNRENGTILLVIRREAHESLGKSYGAVPLITGKLDSGVTVSLYHNHCIENSTQFLAYQDLIFKSTYIVFGSTQNSYNRLSCVLENGLHWSGLSQIDTSDFQTIKHKSVEDHVYHWFNAKIQFSTQLQNEALVFPRKEVSRII